LVWLPGCGGGGASPTDAGGPEVGTDAGSQSDAAGTEGSPSCPEATSRAWSTQAVRVDGNSSDTSSGPQVGFDAMGNAVAVWEQDGLSTDVWTLWASVRTPDGNWSAPQRIDGTGSVGTQIEPLPALAVSAGGSAVVVFQEDVASGTGPHASYVGYALYTPGGGWAAAGSFTPPIVPNQVGDNQRPQVAIDSVGNAMAVWAQDMGDSSLNPDFGLQIYAARLTAGHGWSAPVLLSNYGLSGFTQTPHVAVDDRGDAVAAWGANPANMPVRAMAAHFDGASGLWDPETFVDQCTACPSNVGILPRVALDTAGNAQVVWAQGQSGGPISVYAASYSTAAQGWTSAVQLDGNLMTNYNASSVRVLVDAMGSATAVWVNQANDPSHPNSIIAARYAGGAWQAALPIDTQKPGGNGRPSIAVDDQGDVLVAWDDQSNVWATELPNGGAWAPETELDSQDDSAATPAVAFTHGCPTAIALYVNATGQGGGDRGGIFSLVYR
jgi:hypothetical protein